MLIFNNTIDFGSVELLYFLHLLEGLGLDALVKSGLPNVEVKD